MFAYSGPPQGGADSSRRPHAIPARSNPALEKSFVNRWVAQVADNVKIYEIARSIGIESGELIELCQKAGHKDITHHSNAVPPEEAEEIRKAAIRLYKPKQKPVVKQKGGDRKQKREKKQKTKKEEKKRKTKKSEMPSTGDVKPVPPPAPKGGREAEEKQGSAPAGQAEKKQEKRKKKKEGEGKKGEVKKRTIVFKQRGKPPEKKKETHIEMESPVTVRDLSERLGVPANELIKELMFEHGTRANINQALSDEVVELLGVAHDVEITIREPKSAEDVLLESLPEDAPEKMVPRPPVIALLGHVDHGKTSILDSIRHTSVAESEAGGITQDIAAWQIDFEGQELTFVDTPGHEAFTAMRARGAQVTDLVILVVAADDGVMPQTLEAVDHARAAEVPMVVAVNKIDKADANPMRVRQQLAGRDLNPEEWGGETGFVDVSAIQGEGINELLERVVLEAELLELEANPARNATGAVLEARMEPGLGAVTDVIVQNGSLHLGDILVCGNAFGSLRSMRDDRGKDIELAGPGQPVSISGLNQVPEAGDTFVVVDELDTARDVAEERETQLRQHKLQTRRRVTLENLYESIEAGEATQLNVILKADVQGTLDPLVKTISEISTEEAAVKIVHSGVGQVTSSDILLAEASDAVIVAFRVHEDEKVREMAAEHGVEVLHYDVIYRVTEQIRAALEGLLEPEREERRVGLAEVRQVFEISRYGRVAGCYVAEGSVQRNCRVRVIRDGEVLHEGNMASLRRGKNDVREVEAGRECGINIQGFNDVEVGDVLECYRVVAVKRTLAPSGAGESGAGEAE